MNEKETELRLRELTIDIKVVSDKIEDQSISLARRKAYADELHNLITEGKDLIKASGLDIKKAEYEILSDRFYSDTSYADRKVKRKDVGVFHLLIRSLIYDLGFEFGRAIGKVLSPFRRRNKKK